MSPIGVFIERIRVKRDKHTRGEVAWRRIRLRRIPEDVLCFWIASVGGVGSKPGLYTVRVRTACLIHLGD